MRAVAIIVEYNPLHNGHLYHLQETKKRFPDAPIIAVLNGNFLQRGEPALMNKYQRTRFALLAGVDLVVELPFAYGTQRADIFADGAIQIAAGLGATALVYGSELQAAKDASLETLKPNEKLAYFYNHALQQRHVNITPVPIARVLAAYEDTTLTHETFASARALRTAIEHKELDKVSQYMPDYVRAAIDANSAHFGRIAAYFPYLQYSLVTSSASPTALSQHGVADSINKALATSDTFTTFFTQIHHKHTSKTHMQRVLTYRLTNTSQKNLDVASKSIWTRVLGASAMGQAYLKDLKKSKRLHIPLITKIKDLPQAHYELQINSLIAYATITQTPIRHALMQENSNNIIRL